jgi:hypothetical protein
MKTIQQNEKFSQILGILNDIFKPTLVQKFSRIKVCNELALHIVYKDRKFRPLEERTKKQKKKKKKTDIIQN